MVPTYTVWLLVNLAPLFGSFSMLEILLGWATFTRQLNTLFPVTYALAIISFLFALWRLKGNPLQRLLLSLSFPFAFVQSFDTIYNKLGYLLHPKAFAGTMNPAIILVEMSWLVLGLSTLTFWRLTKKSMAPLLLFLGGFILWAVLDYPSISGLQPVGVGLVLNIALKIDAAALFIVLLYDGTSQVHH